MKLLSAVLLVVILSASASQIHANENKPIDMTLENISGQYAECTAYYELVMDAMELSNKSDAAKSYKELRDVVMFYSLLLANEGRTQEMGVQVTNSRIEMSKQQMLKEIDNRNENIAILINKYLSGCQNILEKPPEQVQTLLLSKMKEVGKNH